MKQKQNNLTNQFTKVTKIMKHLKMSMYLLFSVVIFISCESETTTLPENLESSNQFEEMSIIEKQKLFNQIIENFQKSKSNVSAKEEISYKGQLCGVNITGMYTDETDYQNLHIYYFNGVAGDVISIYVPRTTIGFDSAFNLYHESDNGNNIVNIWRDDDIADTFGGCFSDPYLGNYSLPYSGLYTLTVMRAASCGFPYGYEIITTGINCNDSDGDGVLNENDAHPNSDMRQKMNIGGTNTNIDNKMVKNGTMMMDQLNDLIDQINAQYNGENYDYLHKRFMTELSQITYNWRMARLITATQRSQISSIAWGANIPYNYN